MKNENYYVGLDIGTDSVGYAVTDERYELCKYKGEAMWGVTLFDPAELAAKRRSVRAARRRLDRRQQRVKMIEELFEEEILKIDKNFFTRRRSSYLYPESSEDKVRIFGGLEEQREYVKSYPTIHHLLLELMNSKEPHDARLVFIACAWLVAHRGHFLSEIESESLSDVTDFTGVYTELTEFITREGRYSLPWSEDIDRGRLADILRVKAGITKKAALISNALFEGKAPKAINEALEYNYSLVIKLICGGEAGLKDLFGVDEYEMLEEKKISLKYEEGRLASIMQSLDEEDAELIRILKKIFDWSMLSDILKGKDSISEAKICIYDQHERDLKDLKALIRRYAPERYSEVFRRNGVKGNYVSYIGKGMTDSRDIKYNDSKCQREDFCKYILSVLKSIAPSEEDMSLYSDMIARLEANDFMPKQVDGDNRVIPYQLYLHELKLILEKAKTYIPFLAETDCDGISGAEKVIYIFKFRIPYFVGPLKENPEEDRKRNCWMVRRVENGIKSQGRIMPWSFERQVDLDASEQAFIKRMTNFCTYLPGEYVLPKNSLVFCAFEVLNEINNIRINGKAIPVNVKQGIFDSVFMAHDRVTVSMIRRYLAACGLISDEDVLSGLDISIKSSLKPFRAFRRLVSDGLLSYADAEQIITQATYSEDRIRFKSRIRELYPHLPEDDVKYISKLKLKEFGRLSRKLLCGIEGAVNPSTGEYMSIIRTMWETNCNFMEIIYSDKFEFKEKIDSIVKEYYDLNPKSLSERLEDMCVSNAVKRPIIRTLDILTDIVKVKGEAPKAIFIEMARGAEEDKKGKRTQTRLEQIISLYKKVDFEDVRELSRLLDSWGDAAHSRLQSDKLFLYFMQMGKCMYTEAPIDIEQLMSENSRYNIDHIYPRCFVKDDSVINNKVLVCSEANGAKGDRYPIDKKIRENRYSFWKHLHSSGLISDEKLKRLTRDTHFTDAEKFEFINRQLVETRQSTKAVATLLKEMYPECEIVYVKAGLVSDFRRNFNDRRSGDTEYQEFDIPKSRAVNDLHHAKDAYLNIVCGNVWHHKFSKRFWKSEENNNAKPEVVFTHSVKWGGKVIWNGAADKARIVKIAKRNTAHITMYSYCKHSGQKGGFFNQNPVSAKEGLIPLKKGMPTEIYGGYDKATVSGFTLARYRIGKKTELSLIPLIMLNISRFSESEASAMKLISELVGEGAYDIELPLGRRIIKNYSMISFDGARYCIRGKADATSIGLMNMMPFKTSAENEAYIKKLETFNKKKAKNSALVYDERYDAVSKEKNELLYAHYLDKLSAWPYSTRPGCEALRGKLVKRTDDFKALDIYSQATLLLQVQGIFGRMIEADLGAIGESSHSGIAKLSLKLSNWKKSYSDVRIIDSSASGLFERSSENLLKLI